MGDIETLIESPGAKDIPVDQVFTPEMFRELYVLMDAEKWDNLHVVEEMWNTKYRLCAIISEFIKDKEIGAKRLMSMPDRYTNTIHQVSQSKATKYKPPPAFRPSVI